MNILTLENKKYSYNFFGSVKGFSWDLYLGILGFVIFSSGMSMLMSYYDNVYKLSIVRFQNTINRKIRYFINNILYNIAIITNGGIEFEEEFSETQILPKFQKIVFGFFGTVIIAYYTAITTTYLATIKSTFNIKTLQDIRSLDLKLGIPLRYVQIARTQLNIQNILPYNWETNDDMEFIISDLLLNKIQGVLLDSISASYYIKKYCIITKLPQDIFVTHYPIYFKKHIDYKLYIDFTKHVIELLTSNLYNTFNEKYISPASQINCNLDNVPKTVYFKDIIGLFVICITLSSLGLLLMIIRYLVIKIMCFIMTQQGTISKETSTTSSIRNEEEISIEIK